MLACPPSIVDRYNAYDAAFSDRRVGALEHIESPDFKDTDPDGTTRSLNQASQDQRRFFAMVQSLALRSEIRCASVSDDFVVTVAAMTIDAVYTPPNHQARHVLEVYINHDVWKKINGRWRLASQTTVTLDGTDNGKPVHQRLASPHPIH